MFRPCKWAIITIVTYILFRLYVVHMYWLPQFEDITSLLK